MLIYIEDYMKQHRSKSRAFAETRLIAAGGTAAAVTTENRAVARSRARLFALSLQASSELALPSASELDELYAEATLI